MSSLKDMYRTVLKDTFPDTMTITLGDAVLTYKKRTWHIDGETKGLRYGENPDQPAALYEMESGKLAIDGVEWRGPQGIMSALTEAQMLQAGKHPGKTNLTDVDNGCNILQYLAERPAAVILKHNNPCGAAWSKESVGDALAKAFWCDRIAAFGGAVVVNRPLDMPTSSPPTILKWSPPPTSKRACSKNSPHAKTSVSSSCPPSPASANSRAFLSLTSRAWPTAASSSSNPS